jgi:hypothetical protein
MAKRTPKSLELLEPILIDTFGLERLIPPQPLLSEWLLATGELDNDDERLLQKTLLKIIADGDSWNEEELKMNRVGGPIH